jgi:DDE superfamily endonuclease
MVNKKRPFCSRPFGGSAPCAAAKLAPLLFCPGMLPVYSASPTNRRCRTSKSSGPGSCWRLPLAKRSRVSPAVGNAIAPPSGAFVAVTRRLASRGSWLPPTARAVPSGFPPLQRAQILQLACLEPIAKGLHITHWSSTDLARQAVADGILEAISPRSVRSILREVDLQPHRTRFWKTARLDAQFMERAVKILWCYTYADHLARKGYWVVCIDELPNFQVLERVPIRRAIPGSIEQREFEYKRHGTVTVVVFLIVHSGRMEAFCFSTKSARHYTQALRRFRRRHRHLRGAYLIHDGDSTHTGGCTPAYLSAQQRWWRPRLLPPDASWLNQAEMLLHAFEGRYVKRHSWQSREEFIAHIRDAWPEYNRRYAHPFEWEWTIPKMKQWFEKHSQ